MGSVHCLPQVSAGTNCTRWLAPTATSGPSSGGQMMTGLTWCLAQAKTPLCRSPSSQVAAGVEGLRCVHVGLLGWLLGLSREEEDFETTMSGPGTFHYSVTVIWVNSALCPNIPELTVASSGHLSVADTASLGQSVEFVLFICSVSSLHNGAGSFCSP